MKHAKNILAYTLFTLAYTTLLSLGMQSLLYVIGMGFALSLDSNPRYPYFFPFCLSTGIFATIALVALLILNITVSQRFAYNKIKWCIQSVVVFFLSMYMTTYWKMLFEYLRVVF